MLTEKEKLLFNLIIEFYNKNYSYPSYRSLMDLMGYKSKRSISLLIDSLVKKKYLRKSKNGVIRVCKEINDPFHEETEDVKLLGEIACGIPIFAQENIEAVYKISKEFLKPNNKYFLLRANGNSMNNPVNNKEPIESGNLILVRIQNHAESGDWVVALVDNEATIKEIRINSDHIVLLPRSSELKHKSIILNSNFRVQGVVEKVFKA